MTEQLEQEQELDDNLIKTPAAIESWDYVRAGKVSNNWPTDQPHALRLHLHFRELLHEWKLSPFNKGNRDATVDELSEVQGKSQFFFTTRNEVGNFVDHHGLEDFVINFGEARSVLFGTGEPYYFLHLTNKFHEDDLNEFFGVYHKVMNNLTNIYEERRHAVIIDGGKIGFITASHFSSREQLELNKLLAAREKLGAGYRVRQQG